MYPKDNIGAVVLGGDFQGLGVIQSLAENNIPIFLLEYEWSIGRYSRYVKRRKYLPSFLKEDVFLSSLLDLAEKEDLYGWVLYPNNDETVKMLSQNKDRLSKVFKVPVPSWDVVKNFYYKLNCYEVASDLGIPIPKVYRARDLETLMSQELRFPLVLKPNFKENYYPFTKKKAVRADNPDVLRLEYARMAEIVHPENVIVQDMIIGGPKNLFSFATVFDGEKILVALSARRTRQHPMDFGKATTFAEAMKIPELESLTIKLLRGIGYSGIAEVEFMFDERDNLYKFLEINGRPWGWHELTKAAGVNMPYILFRYMQGLTIEKIEPDYNGVKWVRLITDLPIVFKEVMSGRLSLKEYSKTWEGKTALAIFSWKDPLPFFIEFLMLPYLYYKRGF